MASHSWSLFLSILILLLYSPSRSDPGWIVLPSGTSEDLHSIHFFNADTGWAASKRSLFKTFDGGSSWHSLVVDTNNRMSDIYFISPDSGWRVTNVSYSSVQTTIILGTPDGGLTWDTLQTFPDYWFHNLVFINDKNGWVGGTKAFPYYNIGTTVRTEDGGVSWSNPITSGGSMIYSQFFCDFNTGYAAGFYYGFYAVWTYPMITKTTDSGLSWQSSFYPPFEFGTGDLRSIFFCNQDTGWSVGSVTDSVMSRGLILKTVDGGLNWESILPDSLAQIIGIEDIFFINPNTGWVVNFRGTILKTIDGGESWKIQQSGVSLRLKDIFFFSPEIGWIAGDDGIILKTSSGGITVIDSDPIKPGIFPEKMALDQNYPNPFNSSTRISFYVPENQAVTMALFDLSGKKVAVLLNNKMLQGQHTLTFNADDLASGIYFYQLRVGNQWKNRKMVVLK